MQIGAAEEDNNIFESTDAVAAIDEISSDSIMEYDSRMPGPWLQIADSIGLAGLTEPYYTRNIFGLNGV